ncbi:MAG: rod shape-determining protein MreD [Rhodospirillales bacterium]|nr:rod shape-determining protein MreD [Rhodospirillales bacterium]
MEIERTPGIRPQPTLWRQFDALGRQSFPALGTALGMLAIAAPLGLPGQAELLPGFALAAVFFWSVFRPAAMPPAMVFMLGLFADLLGFAPLGVRVLILLFTYGLALRWRRRLASQQFAVVWLAFVVVAAGAAGLEWGLDSLLSLRALPPAPALFEFALAAGLYPPLAAVLTRAHRGIAAWERA